MLPSIPTKYLLVASIVLLFTVWNAVGFHQGDEHFQVLEFALHRAGVDGAALTWEYEEQMRPGLQPFLAYAVIEGLSAVGVRDPFFTAGLLRFLSAALFLIVALRLYRAYAGNFIRPQDRKWLALCLLFTWCNVYAGVRFASEAWSGAFFVFGLLAFPVRDPIATGAGPYMQRTVTRSSAFWAGCCFGLSFELRYQLALAILGFLVWVLFQTRPKVKDLVLLVAGGLLLVGLGTLADAWLYGEWVFAPWNYLAQNLIEGKAATFGTKPWYGYVEYIFERGIPPFSLVYLAAIGWFCWRYRRDPITWSFLVFFVVHSALSRKDIRFLFPLLPFLALALAVLYRDVRNRYGEGIFDRGWPKRVLSLLVVANCAILATVMFRPMNSNLPATRYVYDHYEEPVTLLADGKHIYNHSDLVHRFYRRDNLRILLVRDREHLPVCPTGTCLYTEQTSNPSAPAGARLVYTTAPWFLNYFDAWGLLRRQRHWYVYEI